MLLTLLTEIILPASVQESHSYETRDHVE